MRYAGTTRMGSIENTTRKDKVDKVDKASNRQSRAERLKKLKQMKVENKKLGDKEVQLEMSKQKLQRTTSQEVHSDEEEQDKDHTSRPGDDGKKWEWSLEECEEWDKAQNKHRWASKSTNYQNFASIAENTYYKSIGAHQPDKDVYKQAKLREPSDESRHEPGSSPSLVKLYESPSKDALNALSEDIVARGKASISKKRHRTENADVDTYINEKNRLFNLKLNQQFDK